MYFHSCIMLTFSEAEFGSDLQRASVNLRDRILRKPLGLKFSEADLKMEAGDHHLVCMDGHEVIGVILLRRAGPNVVKMRQVAIAEEWQYKGVGTQLMAFAEDFVARNGFRRIEMNARDTAIPFYEKLGYAVMGEEFMEVGISHHKMFKELEP